jgi:signal transduction histidine kinase
MQQFPLPQGERGNNEQTLALAIDIGELGVFTVDLVSHTASYSDRIMTWFGLQEQDLLLEEVFAKIHPDDVSRVSDAINRSVAGEKNGRHDITYHIIHAEHNTICHLRSIGQVQYSNGSAVSISGIIQDITPQIVANKERLAAVFNASQSGMFTFSPVRDAERNIIDFRFVITNPSFAGYVGQTPEVLNGALGSTWFPGYLTNGVFDMYKHTYETGETKRMDVHYHVDGHDLYLDLMSTKVGDEVLVTFNDYTSLKKAQLELESTVEELKRSNTNLEEFAHVASHDLKEPIRKIHFFTQQLKQRLEQRLDQDENKLFGRIQNASERMGTLVDDLLLYSHVTHSPFEKERVDLNQKIQNVLIDLELDIEEKGAIIKVGQLPQVNGYKRQLQQLFQNLISNALKYSKKNIPPQIEIISEEIIEDGKPYHCISVKDNGIGFEQQYADKIFQMFTRLHGKGEYSGTGVGLSIVKKVLENHKGFIEAESRVGEGSTFKVCLPLDTK